MCIPYVLFILENTMLFTSEMQEGRRKILQCKNDLEYSVQKFYCRNKLLL